MAVSEFSLRKALLTSAVAALALPLAACGSNEGGKDGERAGPPQSVDQMKQEAASIQRPAPGQYRQTVEITNVDIPGLPKEAADQMKAMMKATQEHEFCLTAEQADRGFRDMFDEVGKNDGECSFDHFDVDGGKLDAQMNCKPSEGGSAVMKLAGQVSETSSDITMSMNVSGSKSPMGNMKMTMHMTTERVGDCKS